jgi:hypothetical protein
METRIAEHTGLCTGQLALQLVVAKLVWPLLLLLLLLRKQSQNTDKQLAQSIKPLQFLKSRRCNAWAVAQAATAVAAVPYSVALPPSCKAAGAVAVLWQTRYQTDHSAELQQAELRTIELVG